MSAPAQDPGKVNRGTWAMLKGMTARMMGPPLSHNPHPEGSPGARCWAFGHKRRRPRRNVPRETSRPGRGRAAVGDRGTWSDAETAVLEFCTGGKSPVTAADLAVMLGRPEAGVRVKRHRLAKARPTGEAAPDAMARPAVKAAAL